MLKVGTIVTAMCLAASQAWAWGQEGHSIIAEIAQRRLTSDTAAKVEQILGKGHSLAAVGSWADDARDSRPNTYNWHFVDIPLALNGYDVGRDCKPDAAKGDCVLAELDRLKKELQCAPTDELKAEALKFAVHFVGDVHQPLHTVLEEKGGNTFKVDVFMRGFTCLGTCVVTKSSTNLHAVWDTALIMKAVWDWGAYVERLENGWLKTADIKQVGSGSPLDWAIETHSASQIVWNAVPADMTLDDGYFQKLLPLLDRQLGAGGIRLAKFLNDAYATPCATP
jgi:hypothetical protein